MDIVAGFGVLAALVALYFIPSFVAWGRKHHNSVAIFALNLLLGWTFLGWVVALIWSLTAVQPPPGQSAKAE